MRRVTTSPSNRAAAGVLLLTLAASACGQAGASPAKDIESTESSSSFNDYQSPLADFLGVDFQGDDYQQKYLNTERDRIDWVTGCMAEEGFEYRAVDPAAWNDAYAVDPDEPEWGSADWAKIYGFGVSTQMFDQETVGTDLLGYKNQSVDIVDPGTEYVDSLTPEEQIAYWSALYGNDGYTWDETMTDEENQAASEVYFENLEPSGCESRSYEMFSTSDPYTQMYETLGDELESMYERMEADPQVITALAEVSRCASTAGFNFTDEEALSEDINGRLESVHSMIVWPTENMDEETYSSMSDEAIRELEQQSPIMSAEGKAILAEVQQYELELAEAVHGCGYGELFPLYQEVLARHEQQFIDAHRGELEGMRAE